LSNIATLIGLWIAYISVPASVQARIGHALLIAGASCSVALYLWLAWLIFQPSNPRPSYSNTGGEPQDEACKAPKLEPTEPPEKTWGDIMAEEDAKRTTERIVIVSVEPQPHYGESEPYIDFRITLINATVFRIETSKIEGQSYYGRTPLMQPPKLFDIKLNNGPSSLYHGEKTTLVVQQPLTSLTIDNLQGARGIVKLDFNRVAITFTVQHGMPGAPESFKWPIGDLIVANRD